MIGVRKEKMFIFIICVILFLYLRTYKYHYKIDDYVPRSGYLTVMTQGKSPDKGWEDQPQSHLTTFTNIGTYILVCWVLYLLWGWRVSLLYAVMPTNVNGVAWKTGNYYMTAVFLCLASFYFVVTFPTWWGIAIAVIIFYGALEATLSSPPLCVLVMFVNPVAGLVLAVPCALFFTGKKFREGIKMRRDKHKDMGMIQAPFHWRNFLIATNVVAYYIALASGFHPLGFFHSLGTETKVYAFSKHTFASIALVVLFGILGFMHSPLGTLWFFLFIGIFSQVLESIGQFVTERYTHLASVGICLIICAVTKDYPVLYTILCTAWFMVTLKHIPAWKNNEALFSASVTAFPKCMENYVNLASYYLERRDFFKAIYPAAAAVLYTTGNKYKAHINVANCYANCGFYKKALYHTKEAFKTCDKDQIEGIRQQIFRLENRMIKIRENEQLFKEKGII